MTLAIEVDRARFSPLPGTRHHCRNPRCGAKLKPAVENPRDAFCCAGCFGAYYRGRCLVCERPFKRKTRRRQVCDRQQCRGQFRRHRERFLGARYLPSVLSHNGSGSADSTGLKIDDKAGRPFRIVAGPALSPAAFRLAALPLEPSFAARIERANAGFADWLRKSKYAAARRAQIKRHHPPVNVLGGYRFPGAPVIDLSLRKDLPPVRSQWAPMSWGVAPPIPEFLVRRASAPALLEAAE
jgi:hypothetical protein